MHTPLLADFIAGSRAFDRCLMSDYPPGLLDWVPDIAGAWPVRSHLIHVVDTELFAFTRYRLALAQAEAATSLWDATAWESTLGYGRQSLTGSIQVFKLLRSLAYAHLSSLPSEVWAQAAYTHPEQGRITLDDWLAHYVHHTAEHVAYIARNEAAWRNGGIGSILPHDH